MRRWRGRLGPRSLAGRLLLGSAVATLIACLLVLALMHLVLTRFVQGQVDQRLDNKIVALASQLRAAPDGTLSLDGLADGPPFDRRHGQSFWIVSGPRNVLHTRWLDDGDFVMPGADALAETFAGPPPPGPEGIISHPRSRRDRGFGGVTLHERVARLDVMGQAVTILVAAPQHAIAGPVREAMASVAAVVLALGATLCALAYVQVRLGLRPLGALAKQVEEVGEGRRESLPTRQPREVAPLVAEVNLLLKRNAEGLEQARRHVANLAHGLKTPLATLQLALDRLDGAGKDEAASLLVQVDQRVRHHLARARAGALAGPERTRTVLGPRLADIGAALARIHADRAIAFDLAVPDALVTGCEAHDVDEIFGNLLDNAFRFAHDRVRCEASAAGRQVRVAVIDDGEGLSEAEIAIVLQPGQRLDERMPGFGFGLTIARELIELYGGELRLEPGNGGLAAVVMLPSVVA